MRKTGRKMNRLVSLLIVMVLILSMGISTYAEETVSVKETVTDTAETVQETAETETESIEETIKETETETETAEETELEEDEEEAGLSLASGYEPAGDYVGFSFYSQCGPLGYGGGVLAYEITDTNSYMTYRNNMYSLLDHSSVAYCFNYHKPYPNAYDLPSITYYNKGTSSPANFANAAHYARLGANDLYNKILNIGLNGYPQDYSGIQKKYGLTDPQYRFLTQYAIWTYTDSLELRWNDANYQIYAYDAIYNVDRKPNGGFLTGWNVNSENIYSKLKAAYNELLTTELPPRVLNASSFVNLYLNTSGNYQHLLNVGRKEQPLPISFILQKIDVESGEYLPGARLSVVEGEYQTRPNPMPDSVFDWDSENEPEDFAVIEGKVYTLIEVDAPAGYQLADNIIFKIENDALYIKNGNQWSQADPFGRDSLITVSNRPVLEMKDEPVKSDKELALTKKVTGNVGDREKAFEFTIKLSQSNGQALKGTMEVVPSAIAGVEVPNITSLEFNVRGIAKVKLKHGQTITIKNLPLGYSYDIKENTDGLDGYYVSVENDNAAGRQITENVAVTYINEKNAVPTGIHLEVQAYICAMLLAAAAGLLFILKKFLL